MTSAEMQDKRLGLANKQTELLGSLDRIDDLSRADAAYVAIRSRAFDPAKGIPTAARAWEQDASAWLKKWQAILAKVDGLTPITAGALSDELHTSLVAQAAAYAELRQDAEHISSLASSMYTQIDMIPVYPNDYIKGYDAHTAGFKKRILELAASLNAYQTRYSTDYITRWGTLLTITRQAVDVQLKTALLHYPELEQSLKLAQQSLLVSDKIDPALLRVSAKFDAFNAHHLAKRPFHQDAALVALQQTAKEAKAEIGSSGLDGIYTDDALTEIDNKVATATQMAAAPQPLTRAQLVASYVRTQQRLNTLKCRDPKQTVLLNCELLQTLNRFDPGTVAAMSSPDLRQLEYAFDKVLAGPAVGQL